jgi:dUTP pyrophosphatase
MTQPTLLYTSTFGYKLAPAKHGDIGMDLPCIVNAQVIDGSRRFEICGIRELDKLIRSGLVDLSSNPAKAIIPPKSWATLPTGICVKIPDGAWMLIANRSSAAFNYGLIIINGIIDEGYTGELMSRIHNPNDLPFIVRDGDRLSQAIIIPKFQGLATMLTNTLPETERGSTGFGSSGGTHGPICSNIHEGERGQKENKL